MFNDLISVKNSSWSFIHATYNTRNSHTCNLQWNKCETIFCYSSRTEVFWLNFSAQHSNLNLNFVFLKLVRPSYHLDWEKIPRKPAILNCCRQTWGKAGKYFFLDENYALIINRKKLFTRLDFEVLTLKLYVTKTDPNTGHGNEAKCFL